ncbi:MAG: hypothetical protein CMJ78_24410 [Planctomycetaceae bacterium]|nr:hypothetical protein [Planctomycetaceae bacterium]
MFIALLSRDAEPTRRAISRPAALVSTCTQCHQDLVQSFARTGHAQTLRDAGSKEIVQRFTQSDDENLPIRFEKHQGRLWVFPKDEPELRRPVQWCFGSGRHAQTLVSLSESPRGQSVGCELSVSWYPDVGLASTLGQFTLESEESEFLGNHLTANQTMNCFACHTTYLPVRKSAHVWEGDEKSFNVHINARSVEGLIGAGVQAGVFCQRCHPKSPTHVKQAEADGWKGDTSILEKWSDLPPLESVNRCGECHRRADEFTAEELTKENSRIVRFASVGLSLSRCFTESGQLTCLNCHDPHAALETGKDFYEQKCRQCHGDQNDSFACSNRQTTDCLRCHMPKRELHPHLSFTDHWISK